LGYALPNDKRTAQIVFESVTYMNILAKIGPSGFVLILCMFSWVIYRLQAAEASRGPTALCLILAARIINPIVDGFSISLSTSSAVGQLNTVISFLLLGLAFLEIILIGKKEPWKPMDKLILGSIFALGVYHLFWIYLIDGSFESSDFLFLIQLGLVILLHPTITDLRYVSKFSVLILLILIVIALNRYQSPMFPYKQTDYGLSGPYSNFLWPLFGMEERFRGPYQHPNTVGIQVVFLSILILVSAKRLSFWILPLSFTLVGLAASRTSLIALTLASAATVYFQTSHVMEKKSFRSDTIEVSVRPSSTTKVRKVVIGSSLFFVIFIMLRNLITQNQTFSGRTDGLIGVFQATADNRLFGRGPSVSTITENSIISLLSQYGIVGIVFVSIAIIGLIVKTRKIIDFRKSKIIVIALTLAPASMGESLYGGSYIDMGPWYLVIALVLSRSPTRAQAKDD